MKLFYSIKEKIKMPAMDGTGPLGLGPLTGRGLGRCRWKVASKPIELTKAEEKKILEAEKAEIEKRLKELKE